ncbi:hypothetical protein B0H16DRAFT_1467345 [Mycena metata]|uniref:Uncharacterized protein n=1 Tax=Mycena metata TaxID=1033252 RepID=A0AAD7I6C5_9AGAR|nr:hypothetical protein B0H16DRAFT_1467345 [Mycena metata]
MSAPDPVTRNSKTFEYSVLFKHHHNVPSILQLVQHFKLPRVKGMQRGIQTYDLKETKQKERKRVQPLHQASTSASAYFTLSVVLKKTMSCQNTKVTSEIYPAITIETRRKPLEIGGDSSPIPIEMQWNPVESTGNGWQSWHKHCQPFPVETSGTHWVTSSLDEIRDSHVRH